MLLWVLWGEAGFSYYSTVELLSRRLKICEEIREVIDDWSKEIFWVEERLVNLELVYDGLACTNRVYAIYLVLYNTIGVIVKYWGTGRMFSFHEVS